MEASVAARHPDQPARTEPPDSLRRLAERFDPEVMDIPGGTARIRLAVRDRGKWDALASADAMWLSAAAQRVEPDALLIADEETWNRIARDIRGGMDAFRRRQRFSKPDESVELFENPRGACGQPRSARPKRSPGHED